MPRLGGFGRLHGLKTKQSPVTINLSNTVDKYGFFENQLLGGTYMTFDQTISGVRVRSVSTNFNGTPVYGSYIKINGTVVASDHTRAPDGTDNSVGGGNPNAVSAYGVGVWMTRGHTMVVYSGGVVQNIVVYDTYGSPGLCLNMKNALKALSPGTIVAIGTYDATSCTQDLRDAFTTYFGATTYTNTWTSIRSSQMFLGKRNSTP